MKKYFFIILIIFLTGNLLYASEGIEKSLDISTTGVLVQQARMQIIAENIANINTSAKNSKDAYKRKDIKVKETGNGIAIEKVYESDKAPVKVYDPEHPDADENGFVYYPDISISREMTDQAYTQRLYEANITAFNSAKSMAQAIINLGK